MKQTEINLPLIYSKYWVNAENLTLLQKRTAINGAIWNCHKSFCPDRDYIARLEKTRDGLNESIAAELYKVYCKDLTEINNKFPNCKVKEITGHFNMLLLKDNQFAAICNGDKYYLVTLN